MAYKTSVYPNFYRSYLNKDIGGYAVGEDIGFFCPYDSDMNFFPSSIQGNNTFHKTPNSNLAYNEMYRYLGYSKKSPFVGCKEVALPYKPSMTPFTTTRQYFRTLLGTCEYNGNTYDINLWWHWIEQYSAYSFKLFFSLDLPGTTPTTFSTSVELFYMLTTSIDNMTAEARCRYLIENLKLYIGGAGYVANESTLNMTFYDNRIEFLISINDEAFVWCNFTTSPATSITWLTFPTDTEHYTPQPEPEPPSPSDDPYNPGGYSGSGGGPNPDGTGATGTGGLHDDTSDPISTPSLPSSISTGSGLFTAYNPDASQLAYFANKLWNADPTTIGDLFRLLFGGDAFNSIIGLHLIPVQPDTSGTPNIMLGNWDSGASAPKIVNQYKQVPFGSLMLPEYWGNCIDYSPYTRIQLALPYIGIVDVDTDDVLGSNNTLTYNIDVLSGAICATLHCTKGNLSSVIYQWGGTCAVQLPITGASFNSIMGAIAGVGAAVGGAVAFASGPMGAALGTAGSLAVGTGLVSGSAGNMFGSMKGKIQKSGGIGSNSGALGIMTPYFIITRPVQSVPSSWQADKGYPANISAQLGTLTGYTEVSEINLECSGTEAEKKEIIDLLKKGVLF